MLDFSACNRKALAAVALAAVLAASPAAAAAPVKGSSLEPGWFWQAISWLASPWGWVAAAQEGSTGTPPSGPAGPNSTSTSPPSEGMDQGWSVDPNGQPR